MKIVILFFLYVILYIFFRFILKQKDKNINLILVLLLFCLSFNLSISYNQYLQGEILHITFHSVFIALIVCLLFSFNKQSLKFGLETIYLIVAIMNFVIEYHFKIFDYVNFMKIVMTLISVLIIIMIYNSISNININKIFYSLNYVAIFNSILGIAQFITGKQLLLGSFNSPILYTEGAVDTNRAVGIAASNNSGGNFGALIFGIILYNCFSRNRSKLSWIALFLTLIFSALTLTRIGFVGIIFEILIFYLAYSPMNRKEQKLKLISGYIGLLIIIILLAFFRNSIYNKLFIERGDTSSSRFIQYERVYNYILNNKLLFGIGDGQYRNYMYSTHHILDLQIHSQYLNILAEQGLILFLLYVLFNIFIFVRILLSKKINRNLKVLSIMIFTANFICSNVNPNQYYYLNNVLYYLIMFGIYFYSKQKNTT
ncbi:O-antigen ligase family protein [Heyndrickxia acidiproducens]|uniref:O-antigen ligase family protein n=1 Tax=Heyndrickxia acidiproducens TaxID=1121084 RepID=UPI0003781828|nr:O-antigen ligase family protein [Heyndrickxia acidiproducens]